MGKIVDEMMAILHPKRDEVSKADIANIFPYQTWAASVTTEFPVLATTSAGPPKYWSGSTLGPMSS